MSLVINIVDIFFKLSIIGSGSKISDFKQIVKGMGGDSNASQVVLSNSSMDVKLITKGVSKNTEGKRCYMIRINGLSKVKHSLQITN